MLIQLNLQSKSYGVVALLFKCQFGVIKSNKNGGGRTQTTEKQKMSEQCVQRDEATDLKENKKYKYKWSNRGKILLARLQLNDC